MEKEVLILSIDLELAWGFNYELLKNSAVADKYLNRISRESRRNVEKLLELSEKYQVPYTWGIVGHLFLSSCECKDGLPHPDMPRPDIDVDKDWYSNDPCADINTAPIWYGSNIVEKILLPFTELLYVFSDWAHNFNDSRVKMVTPICPVIRFFLGKPSVIARLTGYF